MGVPARDNNNPLNLRPLPNGEKWRGQAGTKTYAASGTFCVFESNRMGVRAAVVNMRSYVKFAGVKILAGMIRRWAPPNENDTGNYLNFVVKESGVPDTWDLTWLTLPAPPVQNIGRLAQVILAMNRMEAGAMTVTLKEAMDGIRDALELPEGYVVQDGGNVVRKHMAQSETMKAAGSGQMVTVVAGAASVATPVLSAMGDFDWKVAAVLSVLAIALAGMALFYFARVKTARREMNKAGVA